MLYLSDGTISGGMDVGRFENDDVTVSDAGTTISTAASMATATAVETKEKSTARCRIVKPSVKQDEKPIPEPSNTPDSPVRRYEEKIPFREFFLPKIRLVGILIKVDPIAAGIIAISIISSGLARSLSLAFKC